MKIINDTTIKQGFIPMLKNNMFLGIGRMIALGVWTYDFYKDARVNKYNFQGERMTPNQIKEVEDYFTSLFSVYKNEQNKLDITKMSEYYPYSQIKSPAKVCNIGCFYCKADMKFLEQHKDNIVYGIDFKGIVEGNKEFKDKRLKLFEGYPLEILEELRDEGERFDYVLFTRTACIININQLISYMNVISKMTNNIIFLEPLKLTTYRGLELNLNEIELMNPIKLYNGFYIHNYSELLKRYGYKVKIKIIPATKFANATDKEHCYIYARGNNE